MSFIEKYSFFFSNKNINLNAYKIVPNQITFVATINQTKIF